MFWKEFVCESDGRLRQDFRDKGQLLLCCYRSLLWHFLLLLLLLLPPTMMMMQQEHEGNSNKCTERSN